MAVDQNRIKISMERSGFREVTDEVSKLNIALDSLHKSIMGLVKVGEVAKYFDEFGSKISDLNKNLYPQKLIDYREALYKVGIVANDSQKSITAYGKHIETMSHQINMSTTALMALHGKMQLTAGFVNSNAAAIDNMIKKLKAAGISDAGAAAIQATVAKVTGGGSGMTQALMSGDAGAMAAAQQKLFQSGDIEGQQSLQMLQDSMSGKNKIVDRGAFKGQAASEAAKANKELSIATASENFIKNSYKWALWTEKFMDKYGAVVAGGKKVGAFGELAKDVENFMYGLFGGVPGAGRGSGGSSGSGGGKGGRGSASDRLSTKLGIAGTAIAGGAILGADYLGTKSMNAAWAANNAPSATNGMSSAMTGATRGQSNIDLAITNSWLNKNNTEIQKNIDILKEQGAIERTIQTATKAKLPNMLQESANLKKIYDQTVQYKGLDAAEATQALSNWKAKQQEIAATIKFVTDYKMSLQQVLVTELNPARLEIIKNTTGSMKDQIVLLQQLAAVDYDVADKRNKNRDKYIAGLKQQGVDETKLKEMMIQYDKETLASKAAGTAKQIELATKYKMTGGVETREFGRQKEALEAVQQIQTTLPTALGVMLNTRKELYSMALAERDTALESYQLAMKQGASEEVLQAKKMDVLNKTNTAAQKFMDMTGSLTDQVQMALGSIHELTGGFEETMPRLAEQGAMIKEQMGELYAPQFKFGGYGSGQDITTLTTESYRSKADNPAVAIQADLLDQAKQQNKTLQQIANNSVRLGF